MTLLLALLLLSSVFQLVFFVYAAQRLRAREQSVRDTLAVFVSARGDQPSPLAELTDQVSQVIAARVGTSVTAAIRGAIGGTMKSQSSEQLADAEATPVGALASALAPAAFRKLGRNPLALGALQALLGGLFNTDGGGARGGPSSRRSFDR